MTGRVLGMSCCHRNDWVDLSQRKWIVLLRSCIPSFPSSTSSAAFSRREMCKAQGSSVLIFTASDSWKKEGNADIELILADGGMKLSLVTWSENLLCKSEARCKGREWRVLYNNLNYLGSWREDSEGSYKVRDRRCEQGRRECHQCSKKRRVNMVINE